MSSPVSLRWRAIPFAEFTPRLHGSFPRPLIRSPPANRLQPTQLLVPQPRSPGSLPSLNRLVAIWLPSSFFTGPTTRPEGLLAGWIISLPNSLSPRELGWPSDPATAIPGCHGVRHRSSSSGWRALSGTWVACANSISQVKRYFCSHRVIRRLSPESPEVFDLSTFCTQVLHRVHVDARHKTGLNGSRDLSPCRHDHHH
jgi:hypothetical protein